MIVDERMVTYIHSLETPENPLLEEIEKKALDTYVPIIPERNEELFEDTDYHEPSDEYIGSRHGSWFLGTCNE